MNTLITYLIPVSGILALLYTFLKSSWVNKQDTGTKKMATISSHIQRGAMAFLKAEYKVLASCCRCYYSCMECRPPTFQLDGFYLLHIVSFLLWLVLLACVLLPKQMFVQPMLPEAALEKD